MQEATGYALHGFEPQHTPSSRLPIVVGAVVGLTVGALIFLRSPSGDVQYLRLQGATTTFQQPRVLPGLSSPSRATPRSPTNYATRAPTTQLGHTVPSHKTPNSMVGQMALQPKWLNLQNMTMVSATLLVVGMLRFLTKAAKATSSLNPLNLVPESRPSYWTMCAVTEEGEAEETTENEDAKGVMSDPRTIVVQGLPYSTTVEEIAAFFRENEVELEDIGIVTDSFGMASGFALAKVVEGGNMEKALSMQEITYRDSERWVDVFSDGTLAMEQAQKIKAQDQLFTADEIKNVVVASGLPFDVTVEQVEAFFGQADVSLDKVEMVQESGRFTGRALIYAVDETNKEKAMTLSGQVIYEGGRWVDLTIPSTRLGKQTLFMARKPPSQDPRVLISGLPWDTDEDGVREFLRERDIQSKTIEMMNLPDGRSSGRALVVCTDLDSKEMALGCSGEYFGDSGRWLRITDLESREAKIFLQSAQKKSEQPAKRREWKPRTPRPAAGTRSLYFGNLSWEVDEDILWGAVEEISGEGSVTSVRLSRDKDSGKPLGFGFVSFRRAEDADAAMEKLQGRGLYGRPVRVDYHLPRERRPSFSE